VINNFKNTATENYYLESGYIFLAEKPTSISTVLGSCVSVCIYDRKRKIGGMNHFQVPFATDSDQATARFGNVATITLIRMMIHDGSKLKNLEAQILGGAHNRTVSPKDIGLENIMAAKRILTRERILVTSEDVRGGRGRKIVFNTSTNEIAVFKVDKLRESDWYPYEGNR
jgi:chemotaxis protein CheD